MAKSDKRRRAARLRDELAWAVQAAEDKLATDIVVLDVRNVASFTDDFLICTGHNARQIRAIADGVLDGLASHGAKPAHVEGYERSEWVLIDYFDFVVHVFAPETRDFYGLERLWGSAERVDLPPAVRPPRRDKV